jgi:hypothetical protein
MRPLASLVLAVSFALVCAPSRAAAVDITACGQNVPSDEVGVLVADLDCSDRVPGTDGVTLYRGAALDLHGYTLVGPDWDNDAQNGAVKCRFGEVRCHVGRDGRANCRYPGGSCRVFSSVGTGTILGGAVGVYSHKHVVLENLAIQVTNTGVFSTGKLVATNVAISSAAGINGRDIRLTNVNVIDSVDFGIWALLGGKVRGSNVIVNGNARGGIAAGKVQLTGLTAMDNGNMTFGGPGGGVYAGRIALTDSTVAGNLYVGGSGDLLSGSRPKLSDTTCGTSLNTRATSPAEESWGVCTFD